MTDENKYAGISSQIDLEHFDPATPIAVRDARHTIPVWMEIPSDELAQTGFLENVNTNPPGFRSHCETSSGVTMSDLAFQVMLETAIVPTTAPNEKVRFVKGDIWDLFQIHTAPNITDVLSAQFLRSHGLGFCIPTDAHSLRQRYTNQPLEEILYLGMRPEVEDWCTDWDMSSVLVIEHGCLFGPWISTYPVGQHDLCHPQMMWIFRKLSPEEMDGTDASQTESSNDAGIGVLV